MCPATPARSVKTLRGELLVTLLLCLIAPSVASAQVAASSSYVLSLPGNGEIQEDYGDTLARGDFNGDGFDDLAVGFRRALVNGNELAGAVEVYFGQPDGLEAVEPVRLIQPMDGLCDGPREEDFFGAALVVGDVDNNGLDDLIVGTPNDNVSELSNLGSISVFLGINKGPNPFLSGGCFHLGLFLPELEASFARFGQALVLGNFNSDTHLDLAVGVPGATIGGHSGAGAVVIIPGEPGLLDFSAPEVWHQDVPGIPGEAEFGDSFGESLAAGDLVLGLDVPCDLVVGAPFDSLEGTAMDQGSVQVIFGCNPGLTAMNSRRWLASDFPELGPPQANWQFGSALAVGNFDCAGAQDLAIGAPRWPEGSNRGAVAVVYGDQQAVTPLVQSFGPANIPGAEASNDFGRALLATRFSEEACDDLVMSAPGGLVSRVMVAEGRLNANLIPGLANIFRLDPEGSPSSRLGSSMVTGRFDGEYLNLAIGATDYSPAAGDSLDGGVWILPPADLFSDGFESGDFSGWTTWSP